jgi:Zn-dependent protease with chaperone function
LPNGDLIETGIIGLIVLALAIVFGALIILRSIKKFLVNAFVGLIILVVANNIAGLGIGYSWPVMLICAIGGALGAVLIIVLYFMGITISFSPFV